uniref:Uncharacterized protein n=1 Tax=viral metagenome TaxID=1070528 RepID=A0A6C0F0W5_9ZZZZ
MSMSGDSIDKVYYSQNNLDNTFKQVAEEISRRTNKDITRNASYKKTFQAMSKMVYDKCPPTERNLQNVNIKLVDKSITYFHGKIFEKNVNNPTEKQANDAIFQEVQKNISKNTSGGISGGIGGIGGSSTNTNTQNGFTMMNEKEDIKGKYEQLMAQRQAVAVGDGNPNSYLPQPSIKSTEFVHNEHFVKSAIQNGTYDSQFLRVADDKAPFNKSTLQSPSQLNKQDMDFTINSFNLNEDLTDSLMGGENVDSPLYQNIENLQRMDGTNPMSMLEDYQRQRNEQVKNYTEIEKRQNITAMKAQEPNNIPLYSSSRSISEPVSSSSSFHASVSGSLPSSLPASHNIVFDRNNTNAQSKIDQTQVDPMELFKLGNQLTNNYMDRIEERIVNNNDAQPNNISGSELTKMQDSLIKLQRETQPKYIEKVHYINVNSVDRLWEKNAESRYNFKVQFNQNSTFDGAGISQLYKNIVSVELVSAIMPMDSSIIPFDTRLYCGIMKYPYLLLRIDELDSVFRGTNNWADRAFSTLLFDKVFFTNILSNEYITGTSTSNSVVNSTPKNGFATEYIRGFMKFNPAYFEKKKFYNNPLASLNRMTISITDPRGNFINSQSDVLQLSNIAFSSNLAIINNNTIEITASDSFPYSTQGDFKMVKITTTTFFSNRLFRIGDRIIIRNFTMASNPATDNSSFVSFITRPEGHTVINLDKEINGGTTGDNRGFIQTLYISPPGVMDPINFTVLPDSYYDETSLDFTGATWGTLINIDLQTHLLFRIVTRDPDTSGTLKPINVY